MVTSNYRTNLSNRIIDGKNGKVQLPRISTALDSVRTYQFEVQFSEVPTNIVGGGGAVSQNLTLAAKQVGAIAFGIEDIPVRRVNDLVHYPGNPNFEAVKITFDNLYLKGVSTALWEWFKTTYNPMTGDMETRRNGPRSPGFKVSKMTIVQLDNTRVPIAAVELYGVYPKTVQFGEMNYGTNEFSTLEVDFRYDFIDFFNY
jgi:hypothetical protein